MTERKYDVEIACDTTEAEEYCEYLNNHGHNAKVGNSTGTYIDGVWVDHNAEASKISNRLWDEYCGA